MQASRRWRGLLFTTILAVSPTGERLLSQTQSSEAVNIAAEAIAAYEAKNWRHVAQLTHPQALAEFQSEHLERARGWQHIPSLVEVPDSIMPPEVVKYFDEMRTRVFSEHGNPGLHGFAGVDSLANLERLAPEDLLVSYLEGSDPKPEQYEGRRPPISTRTVLGSITEGDSSTHVVYRLRTDVDGFDGMERIAVLTLRRIESGWRILLNDDIGDSGSIRAFSTEPPEDQ